MTQGFLVHAYNNQEIDYGTMSIVCCLLIKKHLRVNNTALSTDQATLNSIIANYGRSLVDRAFDHVIIADNFGKASTRTFYDTRYSSKSASYQNTNRPDSFELSPFDETLLVDSDFLVLDKSLDCVWNSSEEIMANKNVQDLNHRVDLKGFDKRFNSIGVPLWWATCLYFKKSQKAKTLFDLMKYIKENYIWYQKLYRFSSSGYYRNDYALSIAIHMMNAHLEQNTIQSLPIPTLMFANEFDDLIDFKNGQAFFLSENDHSQWRLHKVITNVHVMNKWAIPRLATRIIDYATG